MTFNIAEIATIGTQIAELGMKLTQKRQEREELNTEIRALEQEIMPLITKHSQLVASVAGVSFPPPPTPTVAHVQPGNVVGNVLHVEPTEVSKRRARVKSFLLKEAHPGMTPMEVAESLGVDSSLVREVMRDLVNTAPKNIPGELEVEVEA